MALGKIIFLGVALLVGSSYANESKKRIIGGETATIENYPYQVSLRMFNQHFCGGSIISERHILTAAHCIIDRDLVRVVTGTSFSNRGGQARSIAKVDVHPGWTGSEEDSFQNDLAIITLSAKIKFDKYQKKINLPSRNVKDGEKATFTGWGVIRQIPQTIPTQLQMIKTTLVTNRKCQRKMFGGDESVIYKTQICALRAPRIGACNGDSGGPLVANGEVVGVASWVESERCAIGSPDVYTNVYAYKDFIESVINEN